MLPVYISHSDYQNTFLSHVLDAYPDPFSIPKRSWNIMNQFFHLDLSDSFSLTIDSYSKQGPIARNPSSMQALLPYVNIEKILLDAAHDATPYYLYCKDHNITPYIDLNQRSSGQLIHKDSFTIGSDGIPICSAGIPMKKDGIEKKFFRNKFPCPLFSRMKGCYCDTPCTDAQYGGKIHTSVSENPRIFCMPPRGSEEWKNQYKRRTSAERSNKRQKIDYKIEAGKHRSSKMWYCRLYAISMLQHLDAWETPNLDVFQKNSVRLTTLTFLI